MKKILLVYIIIIIQSISEQKQNPFSLLNAYDVFVFKSYKLLQSRLNNSVTNITFTNNHCKQLLESTYLNPNYFQAYFAKTVTHSSKHSNDLSTFNSCIQKKLNLTSNYKKDNTQSSNFTFFLIELRINRNMTSSEYNSAILPLNHSYSVYGLCFIDNCKEIKDIRNLLFNINNQTKLFSGIHNIDDIKLIEVTNHIDFSLLAFKLIPLLIFFVHIVISLWRSVWHCFRRCFKDTKTYNDFISCFRFSENAELLLNYKILSSKINNNSGLTYIRGIKGVFLLLMVLGFVFQIVLNSPIHLKEQQVYEDLMSSSLFCFIFVGLRIAPRVLLSCSGYILVFKLMCFLDNNQEISNRDRNEHTEKSKDYAGFNPSDKTKEKAKDLEDDNYIDPLVLYQEEINHTIFFKDDDTLTSYNLLFKFLIYQVHYYFICAGLILSSIYCLGAFKTMLSIINPSWVYFENTILNDSGFDKFWKSFLFYQSFTIDFNNPNIINTKEESISNKELGNIFKYEWMVFNEMLFFILTSFLIFFCYRKRFSLFKATSIMIILLIGIRYSLFAFFNRSVFQLYSTGYYQMQDYGHFFTNPVYNYSFYLIGVLFGLINYIVQKGLICTEEIPENTKHNIVLIKIAKFFNIKTPFVIYIMGLTGLIIFVTLSCTQFMFISSFFDSLSSFTKNVEVNYYYLIDIEIIVFVLHWVTFGFFIKGDNIFNYFLSQDFWEVGNKIYFSFILIVNPVTLVLLYQSETRISLSFFDIFFYTLISIIITMFLSALFYCLFESPYKRVIRFVYNYNCNRGDELESVLNKDNKKEE